MEYWDAYDRDGRRLGFDLVRGQPLPPGAYHLVCEVLVRHENGNYLLMRRDPGKPTYPGRFELSAGGAALKGEDAAACARRELFEETGLADGEPVPFAVEIHDDGQYIVHRFFASTACDPGSIVFQTGETVDCRWVGEAELEAVLEGPEAVPFMKNNFARFRAFRDAVPQALREEALAAFGGDSSGHDAFHTCRVMALAEALARAEGADARIALLAALLHDVDDYKLTGGAMGDTTRARRLMVRYGYSPGTRERVCAIIREVSFKGADSVVPETLEGKVVQDADRLDAIGAIGIARAFAYGGAHGRAMYDPDEPPAVGLNAAAYVARRGCTLNHFHEKLLLLRDMMNTASARALAEERHRYMQGFLEEFLAEWRGER